MLEEEARLTKVSEKWLVKMHMFLFFYMVFIYIYVGLIMNQKIISKSTGLNYYKYHIEFEPFPENVEFNKLGHGSLLQLNHSLQFKIRLVQGLSPVFVLSLERSWAVCRNTHNEGFSDSVGYLHCCFLQNHHWGAEFGNPRTRKVGVKQEACDSSCLPQQHFHCQFSDTKMNATCGHIMGFFLVQNFND